MLGAADVATDNNNNNDNNYDLRLNLRPMFAMKNGTFVR